VDEALAEAIREPEAALAEVFDGYADVDRVLQDLEHSLVR